MKNYKKIGAHIVITLMTVCASALIGCILLITACMLPVKNIQQHISDSRSIIEHEAAYYNEYVGYESTILDGFTDDLILGNALYKSGNPVKDAMGGYRFITHTPRNPSGDLTPYDSLLATLDGEKEHIQPYTRYWHGNMIFIKGAFTFLNLSSVRLLNFLVMVSLFAIIAVLMYRNKLTIYIVPFFAAIMLMMPQVIFKSFQFSACFYVMLLTVICILYCHTGKTRLAKFMHSKIRFIFLLSGIVTVYLDLLTFPIITLGFPMVIYLLLNRKKGYKQLLQDTIFCSIYWGVGYIGMWFLKWVIASVILQENVIKDALDQLLLRSNGKEGLTYSEVLDKNFSIYNNVYTKIICLLMLIYSAALAIKNWLQRKKEKIIKKSQTFLATINNFLPYVIVLLMPFCWFFVVKQHSFIHYWFTYRILTIVFLVVFIIIVNLTERLNNK